VDAETVPVFILPQFLLAGLLVPRERMPDVLERISDLLPFTYAYEALAKVAADDIDGRLWLDVGVVAGSSLLALALGGLTLRRRTP
jgi:ABC-2 type transport system permease protein